MRVEAIKIENGFFIPMIDELRNIHQDKIVLEVVEPIDIEYHDMDHFFGSWSEDEFQAIQGKINDDDYSPLDRLIGMCETNINDASIKHDEIIYCERGKVRIVAGGK